MDEEIYCRRYPWKAKACIGCDRRIVLKKHENFCDECKTIMRKIPASLAKRVRSGSMSCKEAEAMHDRIADAKRKISFFEHRKNDSEEKNKKSKVDEKEIVKNAKKLKKFTAIEISNKMCISTQTAIKYLNDLHGKGLLCKEKCGHYILWTYTGCN